MKIAIIGGGWVGCHLAAKLFREHDVSLYEKTTITTKSNKSFLKKSTYPYVW